MSLKLVKDIATGSTSFFNLSKEDQSAVIQSSISNGDFSALEIVTNKFSGIYDYDDQKPYWLKSEFTAPHWEIEMEVNRVIVKKSIPWDSIILDDGQKLTSTVHLPLLNAFKYWITATDNPFENGGLLKKPSTVNSEISQVIALINGVLLHGESIQLSSKHLQALDNDFLMALFTSIAEGSVENGIYDFQSRVHSFLLTKIAEVSDEEAILFESQHPYISRCILEEEKVLGFHMSERVKACCWLERVNYYKTMNQGRFRDYLTGNNMVLFQLLFSNRVIPVDPSFSRLDELMLAGERSSTEYPAIPNTDRSRLVSVNVIKSFLRVIKLLNAANSKDSACNIPIQATHGLTFARIKEHVKLKKIGRFKTLPPQVVFGLIKNSYEFSTKYQDAILDSVLRILDASISKSTEHVTTYVDGEYETRCERIEWAKKDALLLVSNDLIAIGVNQLFISSINSAPFTARRNNEGLFDLYDILIGSIQLLTGIFMARRQDELISLKVTGNLYPNLDPASVKGKNTDYQLIFINKKSGVGGKHAVNETLKRPIPRAMALLIWKLEQFNQKALDIGVNKGNLALFNILHKKQYLLSKYNKGICNNNLDSLCDYFSTPLKRFENTELRRYYVRQHQLRRFFAMVFFWSKSSGDIDTLRWMLGHTDIEHVYHYISEDETGAVLKGIKASYLVDAMQNKKLEKMDELQATIAKRYGINAAKVSLSTLSNVIDDYDDEDFQTIPPIEYLQEREVLENQILELLEDHVITLEPEFFTIKENGLEIKDYSLALQVKELN